MKTYLSAGLISVALLLGTTFSHAVERFGVLSPEDQQRQRAVASAPTGEDVDLESPVVSITKDLVPITFEPPSALEQRAEEVLAPVSLEEQIQDQSVRVDLEQFGYNIFSRLPTTFAPVEGIPVPADYVIGPGDAFILQIFGATDLQYRLVVTREGRLLVPEIGDIQVAGLSFEEAKLLIGRTIAKSRIGTRTVATLDTLHSIEILMVGEVSQPGSYTVSGLSSLVNTLITTGGIRRTGSLRNIQVRRAGQVVANLDLYELLLKGVSAQNIYLRQGDVIFIPPIGPVVSVAGEVHRPAIYELKGESTVDQVIQLAGGLLPTVAKDKTQIERIDQQRGYTLVQADLNRGGGQLEVRNGDLVRLLPVINKMDRVVLLSGHVLTPGGYQWRPDLRVSELLGSRDTLRQGADLSIALVEREDRLSKRSEVRYFNLEQALKTPGSDADLVLQPRDRLVIFDTHTPRAKQLSEIVAKFKRESVASAPAPLIDIRGFSRHPGIYPLHLGQRLLDVIDNSGGIQSGTDLNYSLIARTDPLTLELELISLRLDEARLNPLSDHNPVMQPRDRVYLFDAEIDRSELIKPELQKLVKQTQYGSLTAAVEVSGSVAHPGRYPLTPGMRIDDLIRAAGGMREEAFGLTATLSRRAFLDSEFSRTDQIAVSLTRDNPLLYSGRTVLEPYDHLILRQKPEWISKPKRVSVSGEVIYPGTYEVDRKESLCGLIQKVGGFTEDAYLFGTVFTRESVRQREQEALDRLQAQMDDLLAEVQMSPGFDKDTKMPINQSALDTFRIIQQLKPERARGRMVVDMEGAARQCRESSDLVLEDGDSIYVPRYIEEVSVVGQVYFPTSHQYRDDRGAYDYINLSGGTKELAQPDHVYIVQANGEVLTARPVDSVWGWLRAPLNVSVTPGSTVYVPLSVDRINGRELAQSWVDLVYKLTLSAASIDFLFNE